MSVVERQPPDSIVVYSAAAGTTAQDGVFTPILLKYLETPGLELTAMLRKVRSDVREKTGGSQRTGNYDQLESEIFLAGPGVGPSTGSGTGSVIAMGNRDSSTSSSSSGSEDGFVLVRGGTFQMG